MVVTLGEYDYNKGNCYNVVIVGAGPAAVTAAIYCARSDYKVVMIGEEYGGAIARTYLIENYPGIIGSGYDLMEKFEEHYTKLGIPLEYDTVVSVKKDENVKRGFVIDTLSGRKFYSDVVIVCSGRKERKLGIPGEEELHGKGVSYCATCDGAFFRDKDVIVVGGSDSAAVEALFLAQFVNKVYIVYRRNKLRAEAALVKQVEENPKIEIIYNTTLKKINGTGGVESVEFNDGTIFKCSAVFIEIGADPRTDFLKDLNVELNDKGEIVVDRFARTNIDGLFAAGDVTDIREKQVITACGQAASAAYSVRDYFQAWEREKFQ